MIPYDSQAAEKERVERLAQLLKQGPHAPLRGTDKALVDSYINTPSLAGSPGSALPPPPPDHTLASLLAETKSRLDGLESRVDSLHSYLAPVMESATHIEKNVDPLPALPATLHEVYEINRRLDALWTSLDRIAAKLRVH